MKEELKRWCYHPNSYGSCQSQEPFLKMLHLDIKTTATTPSLDTIACKEEIVANIMELKNYSD